MPIPREPTQEMIEACTDALMDRGYRAIDDNDIPRLLRTVLAAAPRSMPATPPYDPAPMAMEGNGPQGAGDSAGTPTPEAVAELCARLLDEDQHDSIGGDVCPVCRDAATLIEQQQASIFSLSEANDMLLSRAEAAEAEAAALRELLRDINTHRPLLAPKLSAKIDAALAGKKKGD